MLIINSSVNIKALYVIVITIGLFGCTSLPPSSNQKQGVVSPSGKYILSVPIEVQTINSQYKGTRVWKVTITDSSDVVLYKDEGSTMIGTLDVYWGWDAHDRVWLYNSDDGAIWRWERTPDGWKKISSQREDGIPDWILPEYAKAGQKGMTDKTTVNKIYVEFILSSPEHIEDWNKMHTELKGSGIDCNEAGSSLGTLSLNVNSLHFEEAKDIAIACIHREFLTIRLKKNKDSGIFEVYINGKKDSEEIYNSGGKK